MKPKIWLMLWGKSTSQRCPHKTTRDIGGTTLFELQLTRYLQYVQPDEIAATMPEGPADDQLARWAKQEGFPVFRNADEGSFHLAKANVDFFGINDQDVMLYTITDCPFTYLEDIQHRIDALLDSDADFTVSAPTGVFPARDWEWAVRPRRIGRARSWRKGLEVIDYHGTIAKPGPSRNIWRMAIETGWHKVLLVEKPEPAKEPWPWQPLWVDEPEHFQQAKLIIEALGVDGLQDRAVRKLLDDRPELKAMTANAPRRTTKIFQEDRGMMTVLERIAERDGVVPQWRGWEDEG